MRCSKCKYWCYPDRFMKDPDKMEFGQCRRFPPLPVKISSFDDFPTWPDTWEDNFCGEFKVKERNTDNLSEETRKE